MEYTATISSKGQITLPADIRRVLNVKAGDRLRIVRRNGAVTIAADTYEQELSDLRGEIEKQLKANGTWGASFEEGRAGVDAARLAEYHKKQQS